MYVKWHYVRKVKVCGLTGVRFLDASMVAGQGWRLVVVRHGDVAQRVVARRTNGLPDGPVVRGAAARILQAVGIPLPMRYTTACFVDSRPTSFGSYWARPGRWGRQPP